MIQDTPQRKWALFNFDYASWRVSDDATWANWLQHSTFYSRTCNYSLCGLISYTQLWSKHTLHWLIHSLIYINTHSRLPWTNCLIMTMVNEMYLLSAALGLLDTQCILQYMPDAIHTSRAICCSVSCPRTLWHKYCNESEIEPLTFLLVDDPLSLLDHSRARDETKPDNNLRKSAWI